MIRATLTRAALRAMRASKGRVPAKAVAAVAGDDRDANAALYYVAIRYFATDPGARTAAIQSARRARLTAAEQLQPLVELEVVDKSQRVSAAMRTIDDLVDEATAGPMKGADSDTTTDISRTLAYAQLVMQGRMLQAYELWSTFAETRAALACLRTNATLGSAGRFAGRWGSGATLAVVLPGRVESEAEAEILSHTIVARTSLASCECPKPGEARTDLAFLNLDRYLDLARRRGHSGTVPIVTKGVAQRLVRKCPRSLRDRTAFELTEPPVPTGKATFIVVPIALWAMRNLDTPPSFYFADFYLGPQAYQDATYDAKQFLTTATDIRRSYLAHDVLFVHSALRWWGQCDRLRAKGTLRSILDLTGEDFAKRIDQRWGEEASQRTQRVAT